MTTVEVKLNVSDEVLGYLQREAKQRKVPLAVVVSDVLKDYFEEPTKAEILASVRRSLEQGLAGEARPAHEVLDEIEREMGGNADQG